VGRLALLEDRYYRRWMTIAGEAAPRGWSKRRAMFWGLLVATDIDGAHEAGERIARNIGRGMNPTWSTPNSVGDWFLRKAALANLFHIERSGKRSYTLVARLKDPWAVPLQSLAHALHEGQADPGITAELPERPLRPTRQEAEVLNLARKAFGIDAMSALADIVHDERSADAAEFRLALVRDATEDARYWFEREWSLRAKERYRSQVIAAQSGRCACCRAGDRPLQLNHRRKVRDWGPTRPENLEALCAACHRSVDGLSARCHEAPTA
jgi:hypothetical protein